MRTSMTTLLGGTNLCRACDGQSFPLSAPSLYSVLPQLQIRRFQEHVPTCSSRARIMSLRPVFPSLRRGPVGIMTFHLSRLCRYLCLMISDMAGPSYASMYDPQPFAHPQRFKSFTA